MRYINLRLTYLLTYQSGYFTISNYAFEVNFLALVVSEILIGHKFTLGGPAPTWTPPSGIFFCTQSEYFTTSNCIFNFNFLAVVVSEILGVPNVH